MTANPFDHERDEKLGALLRDYLEAGNHQDFVSAVMNEVRSADTSWEVLSRWARPGLVAAVAFVAGTAVWFALKLPGNEPSLADAVRPGDAPASLFSAAQPDNELVLQVVLER
jgi:hypothetical protein